MARRTKVLKIDAKNRDHGKQFLITEMDAEAAEWWAFRVMQAAIKGNPDIGEMASVDSGTPMLEMARMGFAAIGGLPPEDAKPLLAQMMECVKVLLPDGKTTRNLLSGDEIEEISTRVLLRKEVFMLHTDFFTAGE